MATPFDQQLKYLAIKGDKSWREPARKLEVSGNLGVSVVSRPQSQPQIAPPVQPMMELAHTVVEQEAVEIEVEQEPSIADIATAALNGDDDDILEPDIGEDSGPPVEVFPEPPRDLPGDKEPQEMVTAKTPEPAHVAPPAMTALRADLLRRAQAGPKNPTPTAPVVLGLPPAHRDAGCPRESRKL